METVALMFATVVLSFLTIRSALIDEVSKLSSFAFSVSSKRSPLKLALLSATAKTPLFVDLQSQYIFLLYILYEGHYFK